MLSCLKIDNALRFRMSTSTLLYIFVTLHLPFVLNRLNLAMQDECYRVNSKLMHLITIDSDMYFNQVVRDPRAELVCKSTNIQCCTYQMMVKYQGALSVQLKTEFDLRIFKAINELRKIKNETDSWRSLLYSQATVISKNYVPKVVNQSVEIQTAVAKEFLDELIAFHRKYRALLAVIMGNFGIPNSEELTRCITEYYMIDIPLNSELDNALRTTISLLSLIDILIDNLDRLFRTELSQSCLSTVTLMDLCMVCRNTSSHGICPQYCINIMRGCFYEYIHIINEIEHQFAVHFAKETDFRLNIIGEEIIRKYVVSTLNELKRIDWLQLNPIVKKCQILTARVSRELNYADTVQWANHINLSSENLDDDRNENEQYESLKKPLAQAKASLQSLKTDLPYMIDRECSRFSISHSNENCWRGNGIGTYNKTQFDPENDQIALSEVNLNEVAENIIKTKTNIKREIRRIHRTYEDGLITTETTAPLHNKHETISTRNESKMTSTDQIKSTILDDAFIYTEGNDLQLPYVTEYTHESDEVFTDSPDMLTYSFTSKNDKSTSDDYLDKWNEYATSGYNTYERPTEPLSPHTSTNAPLKDDSNSYTARTDYFYDYHITDEKSHLNEHKHYDPRKSFQTSPMLDGFGDQLTHFQKEYYYTTENVNQYLNTWTSSHKDEISQIYKAGDQHADDDDYSNSFNHHDLRYEDSDFNHTVSSIQHEVINNNDQYPDGDRSVMQHRDDGSKTQRSSWVWDDVNKEWKWNTMTSLSEESYTKSSENIKLDSTKATDSKKILNDDWWPTRPTRAPTTTKSVFTKKWWFFGCYDSSCPKLKFSPEFVLLLVVLVH